MKLRTANPSDAEALSNVLDELVAAGKRTSPSDINFVRAQYTDHPDRIHCAVAEDEDGRILGFQSLRLAREGNPLGTPVGWGIIGTHIRPSAARRGVGSKLFLLTQDAARQTGLSEIEACIGASNAEGLAYYEAMGFRTYQHSEGAIRKSYRVT